MLVYCLELLATTPCRSPSDDERTSLENERGTLRLLVTTQLEMLATLERQL